MLVKIQLSNTSCRNPPIKWRAAFFILKILKPLKLRSASDENTNFAIIGHSPKQITTKARLVKAPVVLPKEHEDSKLSPYFITGFSDGEACFYVAVVQSKTHSQG